MFVKAVYCGQLKNVQFTRGGSQKIETGRHKKGQASKTFNCDILIALIESIKETERLWFWRQFKYINHFVKLFLMLLVHNVTLQRIRKRSFTKVCLHFTSRCMYADCRV